MPLQGRYTPGLVDQWFESDNPNQIVRQASPGDFDYLMLADGQRQLWIRCPGNCGQIHALTLRPVLNPAFLKPSWDKIDSDEAPTLFPSYDHPGCWHGWLKNGVFTLVQEPS